MLIHCLQPTHLLSSTLIGGLCTVPLIITQGLRLIIIDGSLAASSSVTASSTALRSYGSTTLTLFQSDALLFINSIANVSLTNEDVEEYAQRYPELLKRLVVEITEQEDLDRACLERKRNVPGFSGSFALDDYGSGYSNELNLLELSPRYIKIDISIVRGIDTDRDKQQIVSNIVAYAHARSMQLIAEGIETEAQLRTVIGLGVDLLQGYYLSRPAAVPAPIAPAAQAVIDQLEHQRFDPLGL